MNTSFTIPNNIGTLLDKAAQMVKEGLDKFDIDDLRSLLDKIENVRKAMNDGVLRIVLLGSFSDGKTTAVAGLLGRLEDSMQIDRNESTDELRIYHPMKGIEIVDTPGLFGTKEKEVDGRNVKFSDVTLQYLSEAHIVIYVCDADNPIKDSHEEVLRKILRDLGKLDHTIFVLNKMDRLYDMSDEKDYEYGVKQKRENVIERLRAIINLTPSEERRLHIVCIASNPNEEGLPKWFGKMEDYLKLSRIGDFRKVLTEVVKQSDASQLRNNTALVAIRDSMVKTQGVIDSDLKSQPRDLEKAEDAAAKMQTEQKILYAELEATWQSLTSELDAYRTELISSVSGASVQTFPTILEGRIGMDAEGKVSFSIFERDLENMLRGTSESANHIVQQHAVVFKEGFKDQENFIKGAAKKGAKALKNVKITREQVFAIRDALFKNFKFKPWGAKNLTDKLNKWMGRGAVAIQVAIEAWTFWQQYKANKNLEEAKAEIINVLRQALCEVDAMVKDKDDYFRNFAPQYQQIVDALKQSNALVDELKQRMEELEAYSSKVKAFIETEDAEYTEL